MRTELIMPLDLASSMHYNKISRAGIVAGVVWKEKIRNA